jgi:hypothetical protein
MKTLHKPIPDKELKDIVKRMTVIVDTREQKNDHIIEYLNAKKIPYVKRALEYGDYSCEIEVNPDHYHPNSILNPKSVSLEKYVVLERKNSIDEIAQCLRGDKEASSDANRFERELIRSKADGCKMILLLEKFSYDRVLMGSERGNYRSQMQPQVIVARLNTFIARYGLHQVTLNDNAYSGQMLVALLGRYAYEFLKE